MERAATAATGREAPRRLNVTGFNGGDMSHRYTYLPPSPAATFPVYGNSVWAGTVAVPRPDGVTLLGNRSGAFWTTDALPCVVPASVAISTTSLVVTHANSVASFALPAPGL